MSFARVGLEVDESKEITVEVDMKQLAFHDLNMEQVVEPGKMEVFIGAHHRISDYKVYLKLLVKNLW